MILLIAAVVRLGTLGAPTGQENVCVARFDAPRFVTLNVTSPGRPDAFDSVNANSLGFPAVTVTTGASSVVSLAAEAVQHARLTEAATTHVTNADRQPIR